MNRAYYAASLNEFLSTDLDTILGKLTINNQFSLDLMQKNAWVAEIRILKETLGNFPAGYIILEYAIPRIGHRIDGVFLYEGLCFLLEFKVGERVYPKHAINQVMDYALDLKYFHAASSDAFLIPILIATQAPSHKNILNRYNDQIMSPFLCNSITLKEEITELSQLLSGPPIDPPVWVTSKYAPTPTIIEAAQALYHHHKVTDISRSDAAAYNIEITSQAINRIIDETKAKSRKAICFITGVPGAGKTLAGLNIANERHRFEQDEHAIFLSGNGPLVEVLQEALARDDQKRSGKKKSKGEALRNAKAFIQLIHHFRDDALATPSAPIEKVAIYDEAQRAWNLEQTSRFMQAKKNVPGFDMSEPEFLIKIMDRHQDWAVIVCLIGGGQEINTGEAGLKGWFEALQQNFSNWDVYVSNQITTSEYLQGSHLTDFLRGIDPIFIDELHLSVPVRSFRSEKMASFVKALLDNQKAQAKLLYKELTHYPILMTRDLQTAKDWVQAKQRGSERFGMVASSGAKRLRPYGIDVISKADPKHWFLNEAEDIRSSSHLEETATEFEIQGLELDWVVVGWDADLRYSNNQFTYFEFKGTKWQKIKQPTRMKFLENAYRVLLTRARQGLVIFIPEGNDNDPTTRRDFYQGTYKYFVELGIQEI
jgi:hypothetical protein